MNLLIFMILCGLYPKSKKIINKICRVKMCIFSNTLKYILFLMNILQDIEFKACDPNYLVYMFKQIRNTLYKKASTVFLSVQV